MLRPARVGSGTLRTECDCSVSQLTLYSVIRVTSWIVRLVSQRRSTQSHETLLRYQSRSRAHFKTVPDQTHQVPAKLAALLLNCIRSPGVAAHNARRRHPPGHEAASRVASQSFAPP